MQQESTKFSSTVLKSLPLSSSNNLTRSNRHTMIPIPILFHFCFVRLQIYTVALSHQLVSGFHFSVSNSIGCSRYAWWKLLSWTLIVSFDTVPTPWTSPLLSIGRAAGELFKASGYLVEDNMYLNQCLPQKIMAIEPNRSLDVVLAGDFGRSAVVVQLS